MPKKKPVPSTKKSSSLKITHSGSVRKKKRWSLRDLFLVLGLIALLPVLLYAAYQTTQTRQKAASSDPIVNGDFESGGRVVRAWTNTCPETKLSYDADSLSEADVLGVAYAASEPDYTILGSCGPVGSNWNCYNPEMKPNPTNPSYSVPRCPGWPASGLNQRIPTVNLCSAGKVCCAGTPPPTNETLEPSCTLSAVPRTVTTTTKSTITPTCVGLTPPYRDYSWESMGSGGYLYPPSTGQTAMTPVQYGSTIPGTYTATYKVTDSLGKNASADVSIVVTATQPGTAQADYVPYTGSYQNSTYRNGFSLDLLTAPNNPQVRLAYKNIGNAAGTSRTVMVKLFATDEMLTVPETRNTQWFLDKYNTASSGLKLEFDVDKAPIGAVISRTQSLPREITSRYNTGRVGTLCGMIDAVSAEAESNEDNNVVCQKVPTCSLGMVGNNWFVLGSPQFGNTPAAEYALKRGPAGRSTPNIATETTTQYVKVLQGDNVGVNRYITGISGNGVASLQLYVVKGPVTVQWSKASDDDEPWIDTVTETGKWVYLPHTVSSSDSVPNFLMVHGDTGAEFYVDDARFGFLDKIDLVADNVRVSSYSAPNFSALFDVRNLDFGQDVQTFAVRALVTTDPTLYNEQNGAERMKKFSRGWWRIPASNKREIEVKDVKIWSSDEGGAVASNQRVDFTNVSGSGPFYVCVYVDSGIKLIESNETNNVTCIKHNGSPDLVAFSGTANGMQYDKGIAFDKTNKQRVHYAVTNAGGGASEGTSVRFLITFAKNTVDPVVDAKQYFSRFDGYSSDMKTTSNMMRRINIGDNVYNVVSFEADFASTTIPLYVCMEIDGQNVISEANEENNVSCRKVGT